MRILPSTISGYSSANVVTGPYKSTLDMRNLMEHYGVVFTMYNCTLPKTYHTIRPMV